MRSLGYRVIGALALAFMIVELRSAARLHAMLAPSALVTHALQRAALSLPGVWMLAFGRPSGDGDDARPPRWWHRGFFACFGVGIVLSLVLTRLFR